MDILECFLCNNKFDEHKRRARTLTCAHYFCQDCLDQIIKSATPHCPTCRAVITSHSAEMLNPNFLMDDLITKMKTGLSSFNLEENNEDFSAGSCPKHKKCQLYFTCKSHNVKICRDCTVIEHPPSKCQIISFEDEVKETKQITITNLKTQKVSRERNICDLQKVVTDTRTKIQEKKEEIAKLTRDINKDEQIVKNANESIQECMENKNVLETNQHKLVASLTINAINHACQEAECSIKVSNSIGMSLEKNFKIGSSNPFQILIDQNPGEFVNKILRGGATVHATSEINKENRFSQLFVKDDVIHLPALASCDSQPAPEKTVTVSSLFAQYPLPSADVYLTLSGEGNDLGTVYVKLRDNDYAKYLRKLCMGTIGPSYRGTIFIGSEKCKLWTGLVKQYDPSSCTEDPPALPTRVLLKIGTVYMMPTYKLSFWMTESNGESHAVGDVIKGINVLESAQKYPKDKVIIKDVGIVF
ncbi:unnamed protein product, partial [Meganyctiphanes norvegica]